MNQEKLNFLKNDFLPLVKDLPAEAAGKWGKMNGQQMVEHLTAFFKVSSGRLQLPFVSPVEHLPKLREFLLSEKEFRENTKAPTQIVPEEPLPLRKENMQEALQGLEKSIDEFFSFFSDNAEKKTVHPVFGELNFAEWVQLHHKHIKHHLKQFNLWPAASTT